MSFKITHPRSLERLQGVHPKLVEVVHLAAMLCPDDFQFVVTEGVRTAERQLQLVKAGASRTMNSRHLVGTDRLGHAVDLAVKVGIEIRWDWPLYLRIATVMRDAAEQLNVPVRWGGTWKLLSDTPTIDNSVLSKSFPDGPHFELPAGPLYR